MNKSLLLLPFCLLLAGCDPAKQLAVMQHPQTKQTVQCQPDLEWSIDWEASIDHCVKAYEKAGYTRIDLPADQAE